MARRERTPWRPRVHPGLVLRRASDLIGLTARARKTRRLSRRLRLPVAAPSGQRDEDQGWTVAVEARVCWAWDECPSAHLGPENFRRAGGGSRVRWPAATPCLGAEAIAGATGRTHDRFRRRGMAPAGRYSIAPVAIVRPARCRRFCFWSGAGVRSLSTEAPTFTRKRKRKETTAQPVLALSKWQFSLQASG